MDPLFLLLLLPPWLAAPWLPLTQRRSPALAAGLAAAALALPAVAAFLLAVPALDQPRTFFAAWAAPLGPDLALRADALGLLLAGMVTLVGVAVVVYASGYLHGDPGLGRLYATLLTFAGAMLLLAVAEDLWLVFIAWEMTSVCSYLLVMHTRTPEARRAATTALLVTGAGGLSLMAGLLLLQQGCGITRMSELAGVREVLQASPLYLPALFCLVAGCATKSALFPFHFWLPGAMAAPAPVSAYLHAATMVKAGIFLLARLHPGLGGTAAWEALLGGLGLLTVLTAARRLPGADDLKQMLAWSTVLALGTMAVLLSLDTPQAAFALVLLLAAHAAYKGTLFLTVGSIDHGAGTRDLRRLGGLRRSMPWTAAAAALGAASMMGLPPFAGFVAKEQVKLAGAGAEWWPTATLLFSGIMLVAVAAWTGFRPFFGRVREAEAHAHESGPAMTLPLVLLGIVGLGVGLAAAPWLAPWFMRAAEDVSRAAVTAGMAPWPSTSGKALVAAGIVAAGLALASLREPLARILGRRAVDACGRVWDALVHGCVSAGRVCIRLTQHGDLRGYIGVVFAATGVLVVPAFLRMSFQLEPGPPVEMWVWVPALILSTGAWLAPNSPTRMVVVAGLGAVGYGMALLYIGLGAPDVALTQVLVDTLSVVLLVIAFRQLPPIPHRSWRERGLLAPAAALCVGAAAALLVLAVHQAGSSPPGLAARLMEAAWTRGRGANTVNVILVDIRALDTLGEITVLLIASVGVAALIPSMARPRMLIARSPILMEACRHVFALAALLAAFLWWRGHNAPGGGFAAGLCLAASVLLIAAARGVEAARRALGRPALQWVMAGLGLAVLSGMVGMVAGDGFMHPMWWGPVGTPLLFDLGVMALVTGSIVYAAEQLLEAEEAEP